MKNYSILITWFVVLFAASPCALAISIDRDCKPKGMMAISREAFDSKAFWTQQIKDIDAYVESERTSYRLSQIQRRRDMANSSLDADEMRAAGIHQNVIPQQDQIDREIAAMNLELLQTAINFGERCTAYARQKLQK